MLKKTKFDIYYKAVRYNKEDNTFRSLYKPDLIYTPGKLYIEKPVPLHKGGYYVCRDRVYCREYIYNKIKGCEFFVERVLMGEPHSVKILPVMCKGYYIQYGLFCLCFEKLQLCH